MTVASQPGIAALDRLMDRKIAGLRQFFPTYLGPQRVEGRQRPERNVAADNGHIVLKVFDSGKRIKSTFDSRRQSMGVKAVYGPFESTGIVRETAYRG